MKLPTDPKKLKLLSSEYILKHCRKLEAELDKLHAAVLEWYRVQLGQLELCDNVLENILEKFYTTDLKESNLKELCQMLATYETFLLIDSLHRETRFKINCLLKTLESE